MESTGNLYDYPRETIERRKQVRQLRRVTLQSGFDIADQADASSGDVYGRLVDLEKELSRPRTSSPQ